MKNKSQVSFMPLQRRQQFCPAVTWDTNTNQPVSPVTARWSFYRHCIYSFWRQQLYPAVTWDTNTNQAVSHVIAGWNFYRNCIFLVRMHCEIARK